MREDQNGEQENNSPNHDLVFEQLVMGTAEGTVQRLIGMIAYSEWKLDEPNASPSRLTDNKQRTYLGKAETILVRYIDEYINDAGFVNELLNDAQVSQELKIVELRITKEVKAITKELEENKIGYWKPIGQSYIASWFFGITFPIIVLLFWWVATHNIDLFNLFKQKVPNIPVPTTQSSPNK